MEGRPRAHRRHVARLQRHGGAELRQRLLRPLLARKRVAQRVVDRRKPLPTLRVGGPGGQRRLQALGGRAVDLLAQQHDAVLIQLLGRGGAAANALAKLFCRSLQLAAKEHLAHDEEGAGAQK